MKVQNLGIAILFILIFGGCTRPGISTRAPANSDSSSSSDAGALPIDGFTASAPMNADGKIAYRVLSHGGAVFSIDLVALKGLATSLAVEGPIEDGVGQPTGKAEAVASFPSIKHLRASVTLKEPGVYLWRFAGAQFAGKVVCTENCSRPIVKASALFREFEKSGKLELLKKMLVTELNGVVSDPVLRESMVNQLEGILSRGDWSALDRFPSISTREIGKIRLLVANSEKKVATGEKPKVQGEFTALLGNCDTAHAVTPPITPLLPEVRYGHFENLALSGCQHDRSTKLAWFLMALASENDSWVDLGGERARTPAELMRLLLKSGHQVEMRNERTLANFLSLMVDTRDARWPLWLNTGIYLKDGSELKVPMGHSQHAWRIQGPLVNAWVTFFLGMNGVAFYPQLDERPGWVSLKTAYSVRSEKPGGSDLILKALDGAARYVHRLRAEKDSVAGGFQTDGYGYLGVCNDSDSVLERLTRGTVSQYPLLRASSLDKRPPLGDGLDELLASLPHDADGIPDVRTPEGRASTLKRIRAMIPFQLRTPEGRAAVADDALLKEWLEISDESL